MATPASRTDAVLHDSLVNYMIFMARTVEDTVNRALSAVSGLDDPRAASLPGQIFLGEPRVNEMEIVIDEHAIRLLRRGTLSDGDMRLVVAALKITNDLERMGDLAVNLAQGVVSLRELGATSLPDELPAMIDAVRAMVGKSLGALIFRNVDLASQVLESDDVVDRYRDTIFEKLLQRMTSQTQLVSPGMQFVLVTRHLERLADHATNVAEDIIFWVRGLDVRHGRGLLSGTDEGAVAAQPAAGVVHISKEEQTVAAGGRLLE